MFALTSVTFICMLAVSFAFLSKPFARSARLSSTLAMSFYDLSEKDASGNVVSFAKFKGKVVYGVNVATKCGYTASGYSLLAKVAKMQGVEVAVFPCNQFGGQEPGSDADVATFCTTKGVEGANVFTKADVNGANTRPTYKYLKEQGVLGDVSWNFAGKFLVDKQGNVLPVKSEKDIEATILALTQK
eukprot:CAMPEP_0119041664 /NCGR_PEP_ID=MMETSP1177-20130426/12845_1 /TAXON_ID=2985 /ORGANISM="Ochromonas sp, Strain CCMP1899" /LENGTH=186 /DNA_ID=CAMNT_0007007881 /DNA_START=42 /DNA_END=602 /DNA_ORIENTATION=+